jgi:hypothetical protein
MRRHAAVAAHAKGLAQLSPAGHQHVAPLLFQTCQLFLAGLSRPELGELVRLERLAGLFLLKDVLGLLNLLFQRAHTPIQRLRLLPV